MNAGQNYVQCVNERASRPGVRFDQAWREIGAEKPDLGVVMAAQGMTRQKIDLFNESLERRASAPARKLANERVAELVNEAMENSPSLSYDQAFNKVKREQPQLLGAGPTRQAIFTNEQSANPVAGPSNNALLMLPASAKQDVFDAAFSANGKKLYPVKHGDIFNGLVELKTTQSNLSYEAALSWAKKEYPDLFRLVLEAAKF